MNRKEISERADSVRSVCRMMRKIVGELVNEESLSTWHRERMHRFNSLVKDAEDQFLMLSLELKDEETGCGTDKS